MRPIIAVFGSDTEPGVTLAFLAGAAVALEGATLLTGGSGKATATVKDQAIEGARWARKRLSRGGAWVGVTRDATQGDPTAIAAEDGQGLLVHTDFGHARNYLEASLCDAAIAFSGGPGTRSEAVFALALDRPVLLVGDGWDAELPRHPATPRSPTADVDPAELSAAVVDAVKHVDGSRHPNVSLAAHLSTARLTGLVAQRTPGKLYRVGDAEITGSGISNACSWLFGTAGGQGEFPKLDGYEDVRDRYLAWLDRG